MGKDTVLFVEDSAKTKLPLQDNFSLISSREQLAGLVDSTQNSTAFAFCDTYFGQSTHPTSFAFVSVVKNSSPGYLTTGIEGAWNDFKAQFSDTSEGNAGLFTGVGFSISTGSEVGVQNNFKIAAADLLSFTSFEMFLSALQTQNNDHLRLQYSGDTNKFTFYTVAEGSQNGRLGYLTNTPQSNQEPGILLGGELGEFATFKQAIIDNADGRFSLKMSATGEVDLFTYAGIDVNALQSWQDLVTALLINHGDDVIPYWLNAGGDNGRLCFVRTTRGNGSTIYYSTSDTTIGDSNAAKELKLTADSEPAAKLIQGSDAKDTTVDASLALKGASTSPGVVKEDGKDDLGASPELFQKVRRVCDANGIMPNFTVVSRNLTVDPDSGTNIDKLLAMFRGYSQFFQGTSDGFTKGMILQQSTIEPTANENPYTPLTQEANARNMVVVWHTKSSEYIDGAVAATLAAINWDGQDTLRNTLGMKFTNCTTNVEVSNDNFDFLNNNGINWLGMIDSGEMWFGQGFTLALTLSSMSRIIDVAGINALMIDIRNALMSIIRRGKMALDVHANAVLLNALNPILQKYVRNGFLRATTLRNGDGSTTEIVPYISGDYSGWIHTNSV
jgi:hypothetical protein